MKPLQSLNFYYILFVLSNVIYQFVIFIVLSHIQIAINFFLLNQFIPIKDHDSFIWAKILGMLLLCLEGAIMLTCAYIFNKWFFNKFQMGKHSAIISKWILRILALCTLLLIFFIFLLSIPESVI